MTDPRSNDSHTRLAADAEPLSVAARSPGAGPTSLPPLVAWAGRFLVAVGLLLAAEACSQQAPAPPAPSSQAGEAVHAASCANCHELRPPSRHTRDEWAKLVQEHRPRVQLSASQWADLEAYLLEGAKGP